MNKPEILAPGGSKEAVYAAIAAGCDAVYMGGKRFGARAFADNPDNDDLLEIMDIIHMNGKKIYLTVNTILTNREFTALDSFINEVYRAGVDAVIVQDTGVLKFIHDNYPGLDIHLSTQMSVLDGDIVNRLSEYGVTRVVPARELTLEEIKSIDEKCDAEIEVFVHGALCVCMSGQCLMSYLIGGRSGNRGACAQPCRKKYSYNGGNKEYFLSPRDLCTLPYIPDLVNAGVDSFKIEGRMKKPEYVALTTHMYRKYRDILFEVGQDRYKNEIIAGAEYKKDIEHLMDIYNRGGFTAGYLLDSKVTDDILTKKKANHTGVPVGKMAETNIIKFERNVNPGDVLEIRNEQLEKIHEHTLKEGGLKTLKINAGYNQKNIKKGYEVYRIRNNKLINEISERYPGIISKVKIRGTFTAYEGENMTLSLECNGIYGAVRGDIVMPAKNSSADEQSVKKKIMVSGDLLFEWEELDIYMDEGIFLPGAALKQLRRDAFSDLFNKLKESFRKNDIPEKPDYYTEDLISSDIVKRHFTSFDKESSCNNEFIAECRTREQFQILNEHRGLDIIYYHMEDYDSDELKDIVFKSKKPLYFVMPRVGRKNIIDSLEKTYDIKGIIKADKDHILKGFVVSSLEELVWFKDNCGDDIYKEAGLSVRTADNIYVRNIFAYSFLINEGVSHCSLSLEMNEHEYEDMKGLSGDVLIYGKPSAMIMLNHYGEGGSVLDEYGNVYDIIDHKKAGYVELLNYETIDKCSKISEYTGFDKRILFTGENASQTEDVLRRCGL